MLEDGVAVGVEGDGYAEMLHETLDQREVVATVFLRAEEGVNHRAGGAVPLPNSCRARWAPGDGGYGRL